MFKGRTMRIQQCGDSGAGGGYALDVKVTWLTSEMIRLSLIRSDLNPNSSNALEYTPQDYYLNPQELAKMADHINDVLCR